MNFIKSVVKKIINRTPAAAFFQNVQHARYILRVRKELIQVEASKGDIAKPKVINLNANDICNSKCTMCNIWDQKLQFQYTPTELETLLKDPLYSDVQSVGITGGEPTLREDLPELYQAVINAIPAVLGLSIITNAIKKDEVIDRVNQVLEVCRKNGKAFSMMVSLDGYAAMHDKVRGREGNFSSAIEVIEYFTKRNIDVSIGATISKVNVWEIDELLFFMKNNAIYGRFRVAEFIKRLYNDDRAEVIRNFTEDERYHLILFFYKLIFTFEQNEMYKRTYYSIIEVLSGNPRLIGCPYQKDGINVNSKGEIAYCAPKSPIIGDGFKKSSNELYQENIHIRNGIIEKECDACVHDYHAPLTLKEFDKKNEEDKWRKKINLSNQKTLKPVEFSNIHTDAKSTTKKVFIVGWYGTETVGDKAILAGIIVDLKSKYTDLHIVVGSLFPYITIRTLKELGIDADIIFDYSSDFENCARNCDITIMGGGPLMDLEELAVPLHAFRIARKYNKETIVYGCGLGPLYKERSIKAVKEILELSTSIMLRDQGSMLIANEWGYNNLTLSGDFAKIYLQRAYMENTVVVKKGVINCFLREWTSEYYNENDKVKFNDKREQFELGLAIYLKAEVLRLNATELCFQNMHNFIVGNDDRDFSRYFIDKYFKGYSQCVISYDKKLSTVDTVVVNMREAELNICMRFHSVLFAHTLGVNFVAIDYTLGGKINNYLIDNNQSDKLITINELTALALK